MKKKTTKKKPQSTMDFELHGKVFIVEKLGNKIISREELDGKLVLSCVLRVLEDSLKHLDNNC